MAVHLLEAKWQDRLDISAVTRRGTQVTELLNMYHLNNRCIVKYIGKIKIKMMM